VIAVFLTFWGMYTVYALYRNLRGPDEVSLTAQLLQTVLILIALRWMWLSGGLTRTLWSPVDIGAGLVLGHLLFVVSLGITHQHPGDVARHAVDLRSIAAFTSKTPELCLRFLGVAAIEELVYRAAAQDMLLTLWGRPLPAIGVTALSFCLLHNHFLKNGLVSAFEFILFTLTIGVVYYYTSSLTLVILAHTVRNVESAYLEYCVLMQHNHDETEALRMLNTRGASPAVEFV